MRDDMAQRLEAAAVNTAQRQPHLVRSGARRGGRIRRSLPIRYSRRGVAPLRLWPRKLLQPHRSLRGGKRWDQGPLSGAETGHSLTEAGAPDKAAPSELLQPPDSARAPHPHHTCCRVEGEAAMPCTIRDRSPLKLCCAPPPSAAAASELAALGV